MISCVFCGFSYKSDLCHKLKSKDYMSVTLNSQLEELMFSSQIPDLDLTTSDDNEACRSWTFADDSTAEDIEGILQELSEYIEHEV